MNNLDKTINREPFSHGRITRVIPKRNSYVLKVHKKIETSHLTLPSLNEDQEKRLKEILKLHQDGYTKRQITDHMNQKYKKTIFHTKTILFEP